jgi:hypothetical protein
MESLEDLVQQIKCTKLDPGIAIVYADDYILHQILGLPNSPVAQGVTAVASGVAFRAWVVGIVAGIRPNSAVPLSTGGFSNSHFHRLTMPEYNAIVNSLTVPSWQVDCLRNGLSAGQFMCVYRRSRRSNAADVMEVVGPFLGIADWKIEHSKFQNQCRFFCEKHCGNKSDWSIQREYATEI